MLPRRAGSQDRENQALAAAAALMTHYARKYHKDIGGTRCALVGEQSAGKTAALNAFAGKLLGPSMIGTGTRCPVIYEMSRTDDEDQEECRVTHNGTTTTITADQVFAHNITLVDLPGLRSANSTGSRDNPTIQKMWRKCMSDAPTRPIVLLQCAEDPDKREGMYCSIRDALGDHFRKALVVCSHFDGMLKWVEQQTFEDITAEVTSVFGCRKDDVAFVSWLPEMYHPHAKQKQVEAKSTEEWNDHYARLDQIDEDSLEEHINTNAHRWILDCGFPVGVRAAKEMITAVIAEDLRRSLPSVRAELVKELRGLLPQIEAATKAGQNPSEIRDRLKALAELMCNLFGSHARWNATDLFMPKLLQFQSQYPEIVTDEVNIERDEFVRTFDEEVNDLAKGKTALVERLHELDMTQFPLLDGQLKLPFVGLSALQRLLDVFVVVCLESLPDDFSTAELYRQAGWGTGDKNIESVLSQIVGSSLSKSKKLVEKYLQELTPWAQAIFTSQVSNSIQLLRVYAPILDTVENLRDDLEETLGNVYASYISQRVSRLSSDATGLVNDLFGFLDTKSLMDETKLLSCNTMPPELLQDAVELDDNLSLVDWVQHLGELKKLDLVAVSKMVNSLSTDRYSVDDIAAGRGIKFKSHIAAECANINKLINSFPSFQRSGWKPKTLIL